jgi:hypothetical protein
MKDVTEEAKSQQEENDRGGIDIGQQRERISVPTLCRTRLTGRGSMTATMPDLKTFPLYAPYMGMPNRPCMMCDIDMMAYTCMPTMSCVSEVTEQRRDEQKEQSKKETTYEEERERISCHSYAPLAEETSQPVKPCRSTYSIMLIMLTILPTIPRTNANDRHNNVEGVPMNASAGNIVLAKPLTMPSTTEPLKKRTGSNTG